MLQKVGHAAQGEGNCRAGGTRCCSERKLQAVQRFLPGHDIIASRLDFSVWKRMKNLAGNLQPLIYGAFPVWRNCTVRAHICNLGASEWRKRKNGVEYARTLRCRLHAPHLHPRHAPDAGKCRRKDGQIHGAGHVKTKRAAERMRYISSPTLSGHFAVWVSVWVRLFRHLKNRTNERQNRRKSYDFHRFLELVAGLEPATC